MCVRHSGLSRLCTIYCNTVTYRYRRCYLTLLRSSIVSVLFNSVSRYTPRRPSRFNTSLLYTYSIQEHQRRRDALQNAIASGGKARARRYFCFMQQWTYRCQEIEANQAIVYLLTHLHTYSLHLNLLCCTTCTISHKLSKQDRTTVFIMSLIKTCPYTTSTHRIQST